MGRAREKGYLRMRSIRWAWMGGEIEGLLAHGEHKVGMEGGEREKGYLCMGSIR